MKIENEDLKLLKLIESYIELIYNEVIFFNLNDNILRNKLIDYMNAILLALNPLINDYHVKCDEENNPPKLIDDGKICLTLKINDNKYDFIIG